MLVTIIVPASSPIDADLPEQELAAQTIIEQAKLLGGRRVSGHYEKVRAGQAGRLIVNEAREMRAAAIVLPLPQRRGKTLFGPDRRDRAPRPAVPRDRRAPAARARRLSYFTTRVCPIRVGWTRQVSRYVPRRRGVNV